jgi:hypothetical protein
MKFLKYFIICVDLFALFFTSLYVKERFDFNYFDNEIVGVYKSKKMGYYDLIENYIKGIRGHIVGCSLILEKDSSFLYMTCGNIQKGNWKIHNDSLLLFVKSSRYKSDSLDHIYGELYNREFDLHPLKFKMENNEFQNIFSYKSKKGNLNTTINVLKK